MPNLCGAKKRAGGRCRGAAMPNGRCYRHGGPSTGPRGYQNNLKHGIYSKFLSAEEKTIVIPIGGLDEEIRLVRVCLRRALKRQQEANNELELIETTDREGAGEYAAKHEEKRIVRDYAPLIDKFLARIQSLELARKELLKEGTAEEVDRPVTKIVVEVVGARNSHDHDAAAG